METLDIQRYELKYLINRADAHALANRLKYALKPDPHSIPYKGYFVRSLYFDSFDNECFFDKLAGNEKRKKYRLRIYDPDAKHVKFEIKHKYNNQIFKETSVIGRETALELMKGDYSVLLDYGDPVLNKIYTVFTGKKYAPCVMVEYYRDAYVFELFNTRITIDRKLESSRSDLDLFAPRLHTLPVFWEQKEILEIKYNSFMPVYIKRLLQLDAFERQAVSKYTLARRYFMRSI